MRPPGRRRRFAMESERKSGGDAGADVSARFFHLLDELEEYLDKGFFLSFIGKIVVDEKKIYSILNELRALAPEAVRRGALNGGENAVAEPVAAKAAEAFGGRFDRTGAGEDDDARARNIIDGANKYADDVLVNLEQHLNSIVDVVRRGRDVLHDRLR